MLLHTVRRLRRAPAAGIAVLLFAVVLTAVLCVLQRNSDQEREKYERTRHAIPVTVTVTNLSGTSCRNLEIPGQFEALFTGKDGLGKYVKGLQRVCSHSFSWTTQDAPEIRTLVGIQSLELSPELWAENGGAIAWRDGYGEELLSGKTPACLIPEGTPTETDEETGEVYVELEFVNTEAANSTLRLTVAGTYTGGNGRNFYCPYQVCEQVYTRLREPMVVQSIRGTLSDNDCLEELRTVSRNWFAEPNALGTETPWTAPEDFFYNAYPFALSIDDTLLHRAVVTLKTSIAVNRACSAVVMGLSAVAGFLLGFLTIRSRKREITLMRALGTGNGAVWLSFMAEQMLCVAAGTILGGAVFLWRPALRLLAFLGIFFLGLTLALVIFLHSNLITTAKEEE